MKIGVISDTHGSLSAWDEAFQKYLATMDLIIHCGDILYHGPRNPLPDGYDPAKLAASLNRCPVPILFVKGNCDAEVDQLLLEAAIEAPYVHCYLSGIRILAHHGHALTMENLPPKVVRDYNLIISGHTHLPSIQQNHGLTLLNPGSPSLPKTEDKQGSLAILEDSRLSIIQLHTGEIIKEAHL